MQRTVIGGVATLKGDGRSDDQILEMAMMQNQLKGSKQFKWSKTK